MSVYFAQVGRYVKVGHSANPTRRTERLFASATRYSAPKDAPTDTAARRLLAHVPGDVNAERMAHAALDEFRVWGEWFIDEPEVRGFIARCVDAQGVSAEIVARPAGRFEWSDDEVLRTPDEDRAEVVAALDRIFSQLNLPRSA